MHMKLLQRLCVVSCLLAFVPAQASAAAGPAVAAAVQVTTDPNPVRAHTSPQIARNPRTGDLVIGEANVRGTRRCVIDISTDDGRTWFVGGDMMAEPYTDCTAGADYGPNLIVFFDNNGVLYVPFAANDPKLFDNPNHPGTTAKGPTAWIPRNVYLAKSTDSGRTFSTHLVYRAPENNPTIGYNYGLVGALDPGSPSNVYVAWAQGDWTDGKQGVQSVVAASTDGGDNFGAPVQVSQPHGAEHPYVSVGRSGVVDVAFWSKGQGTPLASPHLFLPLARQDPQPVMLAQSTDHGKTWTHQVIDPGSQKWYRPPVVAADPNSDALYVVWYGSPDRFNFGKTVHTQIYLRASTDGGRTWAPRRTVSDDERSNVNHVLPEVAVAPNGRLDIAWYDTRLSPTPATDPEDETAFQDVFYASSTDDGRTFTPNVRISDRSIDRSIGVFSNNIESQYNPGIISTNDEVYFTWQDSRNGNAETNSEDVYFTSAKFGGFANAAATQSAAPAWALILVGVALGMGFAMVLAAIVVRRALHSRASSASVSAKG